MTAICFACGTPRTIEWTDSEDAYPGCACDDQEALIPASGFSLTQSETKADYLPPRSAKQREEQQTKRRSQLQPPRNLTADQSAQVFELLRGGWNAADIGRAYGLSRSQVLARGRRVIHCGRGWWIR
jgi:hypothetical protein